MSQSHLSNPRPLSHPDVVSAEALKLPCPLGHENRLFLEALTPPTKPACSPCVASGQPGFLADLVNAELLRSVAPCYPRYRHHLSAAPAFPKQGPHPQPGHWRDTENAPMSSANPPTGRRQVPVTNCSSRILFSLSISFTTWKATNKAQSGDPPSPSLTQSSTAASQLGPTLGREHKTTLRMVTATARKGRPRFL